MPARATATTRSSAKSSRAASTGARGRPALARVEALARNLWWSWNPPAKRLFESLDPALYRALNQNPLGTLADLHPTRRASLEQDPTFGAAIGKVERQLDDYLKAPTWFGRTARGDQQKMLVAYFCMEYALHESFPLYAGGLGVLAGDHVKSASDLGIPFVGVGILWRYGYYRQEIVPSGDIRVLYPPTDYSRVPVRDTKKRFTIQIGKSKVKVAIWEVKVGRVSLFLLDTDLPDNKPADRELTHYLYGGGSPEYRVRQEYLLGVGGLMALDTLGVKPTVCHLNEGHAAFCPLERVRRLVVKGRSVDAAVKQVRAHSVFTTHTPVPEGNDRFDPKLVMKYLGHFTKDLDLSKKQLLALGREDEASDSESFCMTVLALKLADRCNGVAELHGHTSRAMWTRTYNVKSADQVPIGHVTNGIHTETWLADEARPFYAKHIKPKWTGAGPDDNWWKAADRIPAQELWNLRQMLRKRMVAELRQRLREQYLYHGGATEDTLDLYTTLDENALTLGFARRFALYKRAPLIFSDQRRLAKLFTSTDRPVQLIFAGKAHPLDQKGHEFTRFVNEFTRKLPFRGRVFILQNYDMRIGQLLTQGCDVWLNTPVRPMEASGTSGMKPALHGGLNCSILDGWWPEAYDGKNGWQFGDAKAFPDRTKQDKHDAEALYTTLERHVVPTFYNRDAQGIPQEWCRMMAHGMQTICNRFSTARMVAEYASKYYLPAHKG